VPTVIETGKGNELHGYRWGLIPHWAKDKSIGNKLINARAETVHEKPSFRKSFKTQRCLIPADGFIEWKKQGKEKYPHYISLKSDAVFAFAGIWAEWRMEEEVIRSCCIITTEANPYLQPIHNRMPVILNPEDYSIWLAPVEKTETLRSLLRPFPEDQMKEYEVSREINSPANDRAECLTPC
jgi:putative SOS response-associated peptidase YedK